jgi:hypothetical protein
MKDGKLKLDLSEADIAKINQGMTELQTAMTKASTLGMEAWARVDRGITRARNNQAAFMREGYHTNFQNITGKAEELVLKTQNENVKNSIAYQMNKKYSEYDWSNLEKLEEARNKFSGLLNSYRSMSVMEPKDFANFISEYRAMVEYAPASAGIKDVLKILGEKNMDKAFQRYFKDSHSERLARQLETLARVDDEKFASL